MVYAVEDQLPIREVGGESVQQRHEVVVGEKWDEAVGDEQRRPVVGDGVQPVRISQVRADAVGLGGLGQQLPAKFDDRGEIDVIPIDRGWRVDPEHPAVQARAQVQHYGIRLAKHELADHLVESLGPYRDVEDLGAQVQGLRVECGEIVETDNRWL